VSGHADVRTERRGQVLLVTLDRPKANAVDAPTSQLLYRAFVQLRDDPKLRVGIITGAGPRFFCAGWDLKAAVGGEAVDADGGPGGFAGLTEFHDIGKPVIAAVNGLALGGGFELALAADLIVASDAAEFGLPEVRLGILPDAGGVLRVPARIPRAIALELLLTGRRLSAGEAERWGLVNRVVSPADVLATALELADQIIAAAPLAVAAVLEVVRETAGLGTAEAFTKLRSGLPAYALALASEDAKEGPQAFVDGRPPRWQGR
jgi:crotonobetainyl-CoA hydratase